MDSLTQIVLGAAVGEAVLGKKAGNRAVLWGAVAGTIPDLDVLVGKAMTTVDALLFHRGISHSIVFALFLSPLLGWGVCRIYKGQQGNWKEWSLLFFLGLVTHALLDCFTTWGTQLFWPHPYRVSFKSIFVIDPLYTVPFLVCLVWLMFLDRTSPKRRTLNWAGIGISSFYLLLTLFNKYQVNQVFQASFQNQGLPVMRFETKPTPLNNILWSTNAEAAEGFYIGYYSFFDSNKQVNYHYFPKNHQLLKPYLQHKAVQKLLFLTDGWYTVEPVQEGLLINDLRFGQTTGWQSGTGDFVFAYQLIIENGEVTEIKQRENSVSEGRKMLGQFWNRIKGN
ncbi:MAG: metal-dependent hydrolase [Hymenobacteraceae bacterium]|nr:metal-dependent hydrolase [Hymenobacteraceae bacterium]MDX5394851.1 metal-dependent hydrolase [Hymenobacteraceae bacterium]MDX5510885.1 metal-dependent hydrolase [Hymenobacteraceae bacterium]